MHSMANEKAAKAKLICGIRKQYTWKDKSSRKGNIDSKKNSDGYKVRAFLMEGPLAVSLYLDHHPCRHHGFRVGSQQYKFGFMGNK